MLLRQVQIKDLTKKYGKKVILDHFNLLIDNTKYNIIKGHNGSGKSTLIKCIMNLVKYEGLIINDNTICYVPEKIYLPPFMKMIDFLNLINSESLGFINEYLNKFNILQYQNKSFNQLSLGTKQKVMLITALLKDVDMYIFDEPLNGLDEKSVLIFQEELKCLKQKGKILLIVLHDESRLKLRNKQIIKINSGAHDD